MQTPLVMTIIGPDRTGLVESVARVVAGHGGNWLESRMCRLGGEFAPVCCELRFRPGKNRCYAAASPSRVAEGWIANRRPCRRAGRRFDDWRADEAGNYRQRPAWHRPRNHQCARAGERERRGIFQRSVKCADVRRNFVQGQRASATACRLRPRRVEKGSGKNRRRSAGGCFVW